MWYYSTGVDVKKKCGVQCLNSLVVFEDLCGQTPHIEEALQINSTERRMLGR